MMKCGPAPMRWLPDMDLNHDKQIQSLLCYRYTIGQTEASKVKSGPIESTLISKAGGPRDSGILLLTSGKI
jgi:hypothetical protein